MKAKANKKIVSHKIKVKHTLTRTKNLYFNGCFVTFWLIDTRWIQGILKAALDAKQALMAATWV